MACGNCSRVFSGSLNLEARAGLKFCLRLGLSMDADCRQLREWMQAKQVCPEAFGRPGNQVYLGSFGVVGKGNNEDEGNREQHGEKTFPGHAIRVIVKLVMSKVVWSLRCASGNP